MKYKHPFFYQIMALMSFAVLLAGVKPVLAQSLILSPQTAKQVTKTDDPIEARFYVNGRDAGGDLPDDMAEIRPLGPAARLFVGLTALKMVDAGLVGLDTPIADYVPDLIEKHPFEVALTIRHLLTETAGFATPPWFGEGAPLKQMSGDKLAHYLLPLRRAGQMYHNDLVASALLVEVLEQVSGKPVLELIREYLALPLGAPVDAVQLMTLDHIPAPFHALLALGASTDLTVKVMGQLLARPRDKVLSPATHSALVRDASWSLHPLGPARTLGLTREFVNGHMMLSSHSVCHSGFGAGLEFVAFPEQDLVVASYRPNKNAPEQDTVSCQSSLKDDLAVFLKSELPRGRKDQQYITQAKQLYVSEDIAGFYKRETWPRSDLQSRLDSIHTDVFFLKPVRGEGANGSFLFRKDGQVTQFIPTGPLMYQDADGKGLYFSSFARNGYIMHEGQTYRFIGLLGDERLVLSPFVWVLLVTLSGGIHMFSRHSKAWRWMGRNAFFGTILFGLGLYFEVNGWSKALYVQEAPYLVLLWRIALNVGLMLIFSLVFYGFHFAKVKTDMPQGLGILWGPVHVTLLTGAGMILFLLTIAWGIAGELWPI